MYYPAQIIARMNGASGENEQDDIHTSADISPPTLDVALEQLAERNAQLADRDRIVQDLQQQLAELRHGSYSST